MLKKLIEAILAVLSKPQGGTTAPAPQPAPTVSQKPIEILTPAGVILKRVMEPAFLLLPAKMDTPQARLIQLTICGQEADFHHRWQVVDLKRPEQRGPARGLWQFERMGGTNGVLTHASSSVLARQIAQNRIGTTDVRAVWEALAEDDILAAAFARLLMWTDPQRLPEIGDEEGAWQMYLRNWRPGAYTNGSQQQRDRLRSKWRGYYLTALDEVIRD